MRVRLYTYITIDYQNNIESEDEPGKETDDNNDNENKNSKTCMKIQIKNITIYFTIVINKI